MDYIVEVKNLKKHFDVKESFFSFKKKFAHAVDDVSFKIRKDEIYGLIGESGSGKTTTGRLLLGLIPPTSGSVLFEGEDIFLFSKKRLKRLRQKAQMIFQDPYSSMDPLFTTKSILMEPLVIHNVGTKMEMLEKVNKALELVNLVPIENFLDRHPHELSGGQRQRVAIARAMILNPKFMVADEPVSMLDVSVRCGILNLLLDIKRDLKFSGLYISHNVSHVRYTCDRLSVMYSGKILEEGSTDEVITTPVHPYTQSLIIAVRQSEFKTSALKSKLLTGEAPSSINPPPGCRFHPRCMFAQDVCSKSEPELVETAHEHYVACHFAEKFL